MAREAACGALATSAGNSAGPGNDHGVKNCHSPSAPLCKLGEWGLALLEIWLSRVGTVSDTQGKGHRICLQLCHKKSRCAD